MFSTQQRLRYGLTTVAIGAVTVVGLVYPLIAVWRRNGRSRNFWFDESGQFLMSMGMNHYSSLRQRPHGISDILAQNRRFNLDPGGFSILLRLWTGLFGTHPAALRALPFVSIICLVLGSIALCLLITKSLTATFLCAVTMPLILFSTSLTIHYSFEVRAYATSLATSVLVPLVACFLVEKLDRRILFVGVPLFIFASSLRYDGVLIAGAISIAILIAHGQAIDRRRILAAAQFVVTLIWFCVEFLTMTRHQNGGRPPSYVDQYMIDSWNIGRIILHLRHNLAGGIGLLRLTCVIFLAVVLLIHHRKDLANKRQLVFLLVYQFALIFGQLSLSIIGKSPWWTDTRWSINDIGHSLLAVLSILFAMVSLSKTSRLREVFRSARLQLIKSVVLITIGLGITLAFTASSSDVSHYNRNSIDLISSDMDFWKRPSSALLIGNGLYPDFHYLKRFSGRYDHQISGVPETTFIYFNERILGGDLSAVTDPSIFCIGLTRVVLEASWNSHDSEASVHRFAQLGTIGGLRRIDPSKVSPGWIFFYLYPNEGCEASISSFTRTAED